jgi:tetratricopeptide repeat protein
MAAARAFIVRPFGVKDGIDFDKVEKELIAPALLALEIEGRTTGEVARQGNIREDMFRLLVLSDIVIADVSIYNANAFYELGIRHGLRDRHTLLIRAEGTKDKYPFDLQTDRYFVYDAVEPGKRASAFLDTLRSTLASSTKDSPVFQLLPRLKPHDPYALMVVPWDFQEEVERARAMAYAGDLRLLAQEATGFEWGRGGLRVVGEAQFGIRAFRGAKETFETLRDIDPTDLQSNYRLGTIYQKLAESASNLQTRLEFITRSEQAIARVLDNTRPPHDHDESASDAAERRSQRAEGFSLLGSNAKTRWIEEWRASPPEARGTQALRSAHLDTAIQRYLNGFAEDLDSFYPGINALALLKIQLGLAKAFPTVWAERFDDDNAAKVTLDRCEQRASRLGASLGLALGMDEAVAREGETDDVWKKISRGDLLFLTSDRPAQVGRCYRTALVNASQFEIGAARRNVQLFDDLGLRPDSVKAALQEMQVARTVPAPPPARVVLFTGHMLDPPGRKAENARFPRTSEAEKKARDMIEAALRKEMGEPDGITLGLAGAACGSDILFHEVCELLGIPTLVYLALPEPKFQIESVDRGGPLWVERYKKICERMQPRVLMESKDLPRWLIDKKGYDIWQRNNLWMMFNVLAMNARRTTLVALYNRERDPDGPGGTAHLVEIASKWGFKTIELDARELLKT